MNTLFAGPGRFDWSRRRLLGLGLTALAATFSGTIVPGLALVEPTAAAVSETAQKIANHFSGVQTMAGEFVQFGPRGEQTGGKFYIQRPGKIRFNYEKPSATTVVSDGRS